MNEEFNDITKRVAFISYSWDDEPHQEWVEKLANDLVSNGIDVVFDQYDLAAGHELNHFMEKGMAADKIIVILTPNYKVKADDRKGGAGYEYSMISREFYESEPNKSKIIPVLKEGDSNTSCPTYIKTRVFHDMRDETQRIAKTFELIKLIMDKPLVTKPPLGELPNFDENPAIDVESALSEFKNETDLNQKKNRFIDSQKGAELFYKTFEEILNQIKSSIKRYQDNFGLHIQMDVPFPNFLNFQTGYYSFHIQIHEDFSSTAKHVFVTYGLVHRLPGIENQPPFRNTESPTVIYKHTYYFNVDDKMNPIFVKSDLPDSIFTPQDMATIPLRDVVMNEIKFRRENPDS